MAENILQIKHLLEFLVKQKIFDFIETLSQTEKKIYESTGSRNRNKIAKELKVSSTTIAKVWAKLEKNGLLIKKGNQYTKMM